ncbi:ribosome small subunit-dependent GTPase A [Alcaligenaceae bacterium CGII-47]|nr:ribosome small subunit-dependent GTPase A [Alcaligenaceae bacterium CGII-47]
MSTDQAVQGRVTATHGRHTTVEFADGSRRKCFTRGKKSGLAVGDQVMVALEGKSEGAIDAILPRRNIFYRSDASRSKQFAANIDQLLIVLAPEPDFSDDLTGRALAAAWSADIRPIIVLNKADLAAKLDTARARLAPLERLGVTILTLSARDADQVHRILDPILHQRSTLLLGQSGMGKSTLLNTLVPLALAPTQTHSEALGTGRHTTTATRSYALASGGDLIDSPGFQAFGLQHLSAQEIEHGFPEFAPAIEHCRFYNCTHRREPDCGVLAAIARGDIDSSRHELYLRILAENEAAQRY